MQINRKKNKELQSSNKRNPISSTKFIIPVSYPFTKMYFLSNYIAKSEALQQNVHTILKLNKLFCFLGNFFFQTATASNPNIHRSVAPALHLQIRKPTATLMQIHESIAIYLPCAAEPSPSSRSHCCRHSFSLRRHQHPWACRVLDPSNPRANLQIRDGEGCNNSCGRLQGQVEEECLRRRSFETKKVWRRRDQVENLIIFFFKGSNDRACGSVVWDVGA